MPCYFGNKQNSAIYLTHRVYGMHRDAFGTVADHMLLECYVEARKVQQLA